METHSVGIDQLIRRMPHGGVQSEAFAAYQRGEFTFEQWVTTEAIESAKRAPTFDPKHYPVMPGSVREYCQDRIENRIQYDATMALRLGNWFQAVNHIYRSNQERIEHFHWGTEKMREVKLEQFAQQFRQARERFEQVSLDFETADLALRTKALDAMAREKGRRDSA